MGEKKYRNLEKFIDSELNLNFCDDIDVDGSLDMEKYNDEELEYSDCDLFKFYLKEIGKYSLLTEEEEIKYGKDLLLKDKIFILTDKKVDGNIYSIMDLEKVFVSIDNAYTFKCVFELINGYYFNSYKMDSIDNKIINYYLSIYFKLVNENGIPDVSLLNQSFSNDTKYNVFSNFDVSKKIDSQELIKQVNMCVRYFRAKEIMINHNLRLVVSFAKRYARYMDIMDLIISGNIGLMEAVERFDVNKGNRFLTYAKWYIRKSIFEELSDNSSNIRVPRGKKNELFSFFKKIGELNHKYGRTLSVEEVAKECNMTVKEVSQYILYSKNTTSLDILIDLDNDETLMDIVAVSDYSLEEIILNIDLNKNLNEILCNFNEKEMYIIKSRYGLNNCKQKILSELAEEFNVSIQCINQLESKVLRKMRKFAVKRNLDDYL